MLRQSYLPFKGVYSISHLVLICCWVGFGNPGRKRSSVFKDVCIPELPWKDVEGNQKAKRTGQVKKDLLYESGQSAEAWIAVYRPCSSVSLVAPCHPLATDCTFPGPAWRHLNRCCDLHLFPRACPRQWPHVPSSNHFNTRLSLMPNRRPFN